MVEPQPSKLKTRVRFSLPALLLSAAIEYANWKSGHVEGVAFMGSTPISIIKRKVAGYGLPGRFAKPCDHES